jgi:hypothetical protein
MPLSRDLSIFSMSVSRTKSFSIRFFFADGEPRGLRIAEKSGWNGFAVVCHRQCFTDIKNRSEFSEPDVHVLVGTTPGSPPNVYFGEGEPLLDRIKQHVQHKDFWELVVAFPARGGLLNKAHIRYLEHLACIDLAQAVPEKPRINSAKRSADKAKGTAKKYSRL